MSLPSFMRRTFPRPCAMLGTRRRNLRKVLFMFTGLFTVAFLIKMQHLFKDLAQQESSRVPELDLRLKMTRVFPERPDAEWVKARDLFAKFGVMLVAEGRVNMSSRGNWTYRNTGWSPERGDAFVNQSGRDGSKANDAAVTSHGVRFTGEVKTSRPEEILKGSFLHDRKLDNDVKRSGVTTASSDSSSTSGVFATKGAVLSVLVISRPNNVLLRQAVRKTWGQGVTGMGIQVRFVVGKDENWNDIVDREYNMHHDVICVEEEDSYDYLPNKVLDGFSWALRQKPQPKYIMKVDDDTIVNLPYLLEELNSGIINSSQILGAICVDSVVVRDPSDKWAVSILDYPFPTFPNYAFGGGYVMSGTAAGILLAARAKTFDWLHLEDVYITGILARKAGLHHLTHPAFSFWTSAQATACEFVFNKRITSVSHLEKEFFTLYTETQTLLRTGNYTACGMDALAKNSTVASKDLRSVL